MDSEGSEVDETEGSSSEDESDDTITILTKVVTIGIQTVILTGKTFIEFSLDHVVQKAKYYTENLNKALYLLKIPNFNFGCFETITKQINTIFCDRRFRKKSSVIKITCLYQI